MNNNYFKSQQVSPNNSFILDVTLRNSAVNQSFQNNQKNIKKKNGQSMFQFLKRRQKNSLQKVLGSSKIKDQNQQIIKESKCIQNINQNFDEENKQNQRSNIQNVEQQNEQSRELHPKSKLIVRNNQKQAKVENNKKNQSLNRFLNDITDIKQNFEDKMIKHNIKKNNINSLQSIKIKVNISKKIEQIFQKIIQYSRNGKKFKNKYYSTLMESTQLYNLIAQKYKQSNLKKKIQQLSNTLKITEKLYNQFVQYDPIEDIDQLKKFLNENSNINENNLQNFYEKQLEQFRANTIQQYEERIHNLSCTLTESQRDCENLKNTVQRLKLRQKNNLNQQNQKQYQYNTMIKSKHESYQNKIRSLQQKIKQYKNTINDLEQNERNLQKQLKIKQYQKNDLVKNIQNEMSNVNIAKQNVLLQEISKLKKQFMKDISELKQLYSIKQQQYIQQISNFQSFIKEIEIRSNQYRDNQTNLMEDISLLRNQIKKYRKQNETLLNQVHSKSEQAYNYWSVLKDIKTFTERFGYFNKISKIYDQIKFNPNAYQ